MVNVASYLKSFNPKTQVDEDGYPLYAQPNDGQTYTNSKDEVFDNQGVISHNPYLLTKYRCHINVKVCTSVKAIKYIYKYIYSHFKNCCNVWPFWKD
jgi:hypothetical protein